MKEKKAGRGRRTEKKRDGRGLIGEAKKSNPDFDRKPGRDRRNRETGCFLMEEKDRKNRNYIKDNR